MESLSDFDDSTRTSLWTYFERDHKYKRECTIGEWFTKNEAWMPLLEFLEPDIDHSKQGGWPYFKQRWGASNLRRALAEFLLVKWDLETEDVGDLCVPFGSDREMYVVSDQCVYQKQRIYMRQWIPLAPQFVTLSGGHMWAMDCNDLIPGRYSWWMDDLERGVHPLCYHEQNAHVYTDSCREDHVAPPSPDESTFENPSYYMETQLIEIPSVWPDAVDRYTRLPKVLISIVCAYATQRIPRYELERMSPCLRPRKRIKYGK